LRSAPLPRPKRSFMRLLPNPTAFFDLAKTILAWHSLLQQIALNFLTGDTKPSGCPS
jgi:hypothetical protein